MLPSTGKVAVCRGLSTIKTKAPVVMLHNFHKFCRAFTHFTITLFYHFIIPSKGNNLLETEVEQNYNYPFVGQCLFLKGHPIYTASILW